MNPVVIDTNCLLQIISRKSPYRPIWEAFLAGRFTLCVSEEILAEYQEILEQQITADPDDNKFVDCAFAAGADYLVSEDSHFRVLHDTPFPQLNLVTLDEFLATRLIQEQ